MNRGDLAASQDLEHERQAMRDELLRVLVLLDAAEVLEQALDQRPAVLHRAGAQGLQPGVQRPGNAWRGGRKPPRHTVRARIQALEGRGHGATEPTMFHTSWLCEQQASERMRGRQCWD